MNKAVRLRPYVGKGKRTHRKKKTNPKKNQLELGLKFKENAPLNIVWA